MGDSGQEAIAAAGQKPSLLQSTKNALQSAWKGLLLLITISSIVLAIDAIVKLKSQPLTLDTLLPTLGNLLPLAAFGVTGVVRLVGVFVRLARIAVTIPVVLGGAYLAAPSIPDLLKHSPDLATGGLVALLATPEVLEVLALCAVVGGAAIWLTQKLFTLVAGAAAAARDSEDAD
ncbi:hypothetical protein JKP88DRAFT_281865 [Tribonema minus]|uniref:Uncharacterized protein n=1 Tax=Tribonema minus TaxID=303371 RepID=A0A835YW39_9STRA|nr:hypothetical protein JKP88DRAFT_281865 [Tribonema minus]